MNTRTPGLNQGFARAPTLARILIGFAYASDLAFGDDLNDGVQSCYLADRLGAELGLQEDDRIDIYYTALMRHAGCTCTTTPMSEFIQAPEIVARHELLAFGHKTSFDDWTRRFVGTELAEDERARASERVKSQIHDYKHAAFESSVEVCSRIMKRIGLSERVQQAGRCLYEQWDGAGQPSQLSGEAIPIAARVIGPTFLLVPVYRRDGLEAARELAIATRGKAFDPQVIDAFLSLISQPEFCEELASEDIWEVVASREPNTRLAQINDGAMEVVAQAFADFIDLKSPTAAAHSRRVGKIVEQIARVMRCDERDVALFRQAGYMHDIGMVAVDSYVLNKPEAARTFSEREQMRLHSYYGERILERVPALAGVLPLVGQHHEQVDGHGSFRGLRGREIQLGARIIAVANRLDELTHDAPGEPALDLSVALNVLDAEAGKSLDREIVAALKVAITGERGSSHDRGWPAGLTDREVEVLRLAAVGLSRRETAQKLSISENTVRHHLEHIYAKTGSNTRMGAVLFAMENDLLP